MPLLIAERIHEELYQLEQDNEILDINEQERDAYLYDNPEIAFEIELEKTCAEAQMDYMVSVTYIKIKNKIFCYLKRNYFRNKKEYLAFFWDTSKSIRNLASNIEL